LPVSIIDNVGGRAFVFSKAKSKSWLFDTILIQLVIYRIRIYGSESLQTFLAFPSSYFGKNKNNFRQKKEEEIIYERGRKINAFEDFRRHHRKYHLMN
jgi:hypothetical protein